MNNFGQRLLRSLGLSGTRGLGCCTPGGVSVLAGRSEEGAWGRAGGSLTSHPGGCRAGGPPRSHWETRCIPPSQHCQPQEPPPAAMPGAQLGHCTHMALRGSQHPQKVLAPGQLAAPGCRRPQGRRATIPGDTSPWITLQDQGKVSPGDRGGHNRDAGGVDAGILLPPCSFQHTTDNLTCSRACS